jgi:hypothetical protein
MTCSNVGKVWEASVIAEPHVHAAVEHYVLPTLTPRTNICLLHNLPVFA